MVNITRDKTMLFKVTLHNSGTIDGVVWYLLTIKDTNGHEYSSVATTPGGPVTVTPARDVVLEFRYPAINFLVGTITLTFTAYGSYIGGALSQPLGSASESFQCVVPAVPSQSITAVMAVRPGPFQKGETVACPLRITNNNNFEVAGYLSYGLWTDVGLYDPLSHPALYNISPGASALGGISVPLNYPPGQYYIVARLFPDTRDHAGSTTGMLAEAMVLVDIVQAPSAAVVTITSAEVVAA